jgi:hypothetical protein
MRTKFWMAATVALTLGCVSVASAGETEQDIINRYTKKIEKKHIKHTSWLSFTFNYNRLNRDNDYNKFVTYQNSMLSGGSFDWLNAGQVVGADFGIIVHKKMAVMVGGEYWLPMGQTLGGTFTYTPPVSAATSVTNPESKISVFGVTTGVQMYLINHPFDLVSSGKPVLKVTGQVGYYKANWKLWSQYQNLNLSTSAPDAQNATYSGSAPGFSLGFGVDYPLRFAGMSLGVDMNYLWLNFRNVSWYNAADQEVVATYNGDTSSRVVLGLSGIRGRLELKKHFTW